MMKFFVLALTLLGAPAFANSCDSFSGTWIAEISCQGLDPHIGVQMAYSASLNEMTIIYDQEIYPEPVEKYTMDGAEHVGDQFTGDTYKASCSSDKLNIRHVFNSPAKVLVTEMTLHDGAIDYVETYEGRDGATVCRFLKERN